MNNWHTRNPDADDIANANTDWGDLAHTIVGLATGGVVHDDDYHLAFNADGEGWWWLRYTGADAHLWTICFDTVSLLGEDCYMLERCGQSCIVLDGLRETNRHLAQVLDALGGVDPYHDVETADTDSNECESDNYYDHTTND